MSEHKKFELEDLSKSAVVNSDNYSTEDTKVEELINDAITDHISKIVDEEPSLEEKTPVLEDDIKPELDIEQVKKEAYDKGFQDAKTDYESMANDTKIDRDFSEMLYTKLSSLVSKEEITSQISKVSAETISGIAKKLHLILPSDFEAIILNGLIEKLKTFYKEGSIIITVHPDKYEFCKEILQSDKIPSKFKDNFQIIQDDKIGVGDCRLEYNDTKLEYSQEQITLEIDKIIEQLKSAT